MTVDKGPSFTRDCEFIEKLIVKETEEIDDYDFVKIRSNPFYKIEE